MEITGKIKWIDEVKTYGSNGFRKREIVITTQEQYPQNIIIEFVQDKCELLDSYQIGQDVRIGINLRGREWVNPEGQTKYFNSIQGWRIDQLDQGADNDESIPAQKPFETTELDTNQNDNEEEDDLPF
ncbi:MAG: hypothetical protein CMC88_04275 [Flavobacteriaceae bacterium]|nr:hypothetical protein [Flavobacteriaceae bacterium]|tara:strand:- start:52698 stop:53081 length:384 start_codon:yes stop_codon:yes gene_type:complete